MTGPAPHYEEWLDRITGCQREGKVAYRYGLGVLLVSIALVARLALDPWLGDTYEFSFFYLAIIVANWSCGSSACLVALMTGLVECIWFVLPPRHSGYIQGLEHWIGLGMYLSVGLAVAAYGWAMRRAASQLRRETDEQIRAEEDLRKNGETHAQELRKSLEQRRLALESAEIGTWDYWLVAGEIYWDERCRKIFQLGSGPIEYREVLARIHPEDRERVDAVVQRTANPQSSGSYEIEHRIVWPDLSVHWVLVKGQVYFHGEKEQRRAVRFIGTLMDITNKKQLEHELRAREEEFRRVFELSVVGQAQISPVSGRFVRVNSRFCALTGYSQSELLGMNFLALIHPCDQPAAGAGIASLLHGEKSSLLTELRYVHKEVREMNVEMAAAVIWDADSKPLRVTMAINEVTDRGRTETAFGNGHQDLERVLPPLGV